MYLLRFFYSLFSFLNFWVKIVFNFNDSFNLNFDWSIRLQVSTVSIDLYLFVFKITKDYIIIFVHNHKEKANLCKLFAWKHKINKSNAEVFTHYWIVCLYSKYVCFYEFMSNRFFNSLINMFNCKTVKIGNLNIFYIQSNPIRTNICIFIKVY